MTADDDPRWVSSGVVDAFNLLGISVADFDVRNGGPIIDATENAIK